MRTTVKKWGNSASVRIPASVMQAAHLSLDQAVDIKAEKGGLVITPVTGRDYRIDDLIRAITRKNRHQEIEFGGPLGKEVW